MNSIVTQAVVSASSRPRSCSRASERQVGMLRSRLRRVLSSLSAGFEAVIVTFFQWEDREKVVMLPWCQLRGAGYSGASVCSMVTRKAL